eukprot:GHVS01042913.1.p1 GENE.GHVS01042913.1~~GHVS01042913.1.p1  ORF type:complete len:325 (-),score=66.31 GHVS01042913.1:359-1300(-)
MASQSDDDLCDPHSSLLGPGLQVESSTNALIDNLIVQLNKEKLKRKEEFAKRTLLSEVAIAASEDACASSPPPSTTCTTPPSARVVADTPEVVRRQLSAAPHRQPHKARVVVVAVDASDASQEAVDWARKRGYIMPSDLVVLLTVWEEQLEVGMAREAEQRQTAAAVAAQQEEVVGFSNGGGGGVGGGVGGSEMSAAEKIRHSLNSVYTGLLGIRPTSIRDHNDEAMRSACNLMKELYQQFLSDCDIFPFVVASNNLAQSSIGSIICHTAEQAKADLIIVGSRGFGVLKQFFVGSVSKFVVDHAKTAVLLIKQ